MTDPLHLWQTNQLVCAYRTMILTLVCISRRRIAGETDPAYQWASQALDDMVPIVNRLFA